MIAGRFSCPPAAGRLCARHSGVQLRLQRRICCSRLYTGPRAAAIDDKETRSHSNSASAGKRRKPKKPRKKQLYFEVQREVDPGDRLIVVGSSDELGQWEVDSGLELSWNEGHLWTGYITISAPKVSYKFVRVPAKGVAEWEDGEDRVLSLQDVAQSGIIVQADWDEPAVHSPSDDSQDESSSADASLADEANASDSQMQPLATYQANIAIQKRLFVGERFKLVGSHDSLGEWNHWVAPAFTWHEDDVWQLTLSLPVDQAVEFKIVQTAEDYGDKYWCVWQDGYNTILDPQAMGLQPGSSLEVGCTWEGEARAHIASMSGRYDAVWQQPLQHSDHAGAGDSHKAAADSDEEQTRDAQQLASAEAQHDAAETAAVPAAAAAASKDSRDAAPSSNGTSRHEPAKASSRLHDASAEEPQPTAASLAGDAQAEGKVTDMGDMEISADQLHALTRAGAQAADPMASFDDIALDAGTIRLAKGRLQLEEDGSTTVVRGGHEYDADTDTVSIKDSNPLSQPDGILHDEDGTSLEDSTDDQDAVELAANDKVDSTKGTAVRALTTAAGVAAAGIGGAAIAGGMAVDLTDVAMVASLYGVATALQSSRSAEVREKGAAGPLFSVLYTAADIAKKVKYGVGGGPSQAPRKLTAEERQALLGRYKQSTMADQSSGKPSRAEAEASADAVTAALREEAEQRALEEEEDALAMRMATMRRKLGPDGLQALEDGVSAVSGSDVQHILQAVNNEVPDEDKVLHLLNSLAPEPLTAEQHAALRPDAQAALALAEEHCDEPLTGDSKHGEHAPPVLLAALAMSACSAM